VNIQINIDPSDADQVNEAIALLRKVLGDTAPEEPTAPADEANDRPAKPNKKKPNPADEPADDDETPPADDEEPADDADEDKAAELRVLAKKLIAKDRKAMAAILKKFDADGLSAIPPFKIAKAIALIEAALEA
jgi:hypothetical protein